MKVYSSNMLMTVTSTQAFEHIWFPYIAKRWPFRDTKFTIKTVKLIIIMIIFFNTACLSQSKFVYLMKPYCRLIKAVYSSIENIFIVSERSRII